MTMNGSIRVLLTLVSSVVCEPATGQTLSPGGGERGRQRGRREITRETTMETTKGEKNDAGEKVRLRPPQ